MGLLCAQVRAPEGPWPRILASVGYQSANLTVLEGEAQAFGFRASGRKVRVASVEDVHNPKLPIIWEHPVEVPVFELPNQARVFAREKRQGAPLIAGFRTGSGAVLWTAISPGEQGYERFPYLPQALADLGVEPDVVSRRLWAFFDSSYRLRVDLDYFARRWREAGIAALHVAAWHFYEPSASGDVYLRRLIEACHRNGILVYAWFELPHVSESFWNTHPEWREKTALLQDAHLDWRKLMNLANRDCFRTVSLGVRQLIQRFDWDGVNLAELYFESLEGHANPSRFTPMNEDVRREFHQAHGFDPLALFKTPSPGGIRAFLDYRADLAHRIESEWMNEIEAARREKPDLDLVLTHVDDRLDRGMRDAIGVDSTRLATGDFDLLIEDPATVWHLGPDRYHELARRYQPLGLPGAKLAVDINIVERYQDVYPTKQQTGAELFQLVHQASQAFGRVALYFESSILAPDLSLLPAAAAVVNRFDRTGEKLTVDSPRGIGIRWKGPARVDGRVWPVANDEILWVTPGIHEIEASAERPPVRLLDFNGDLKDARALPRGIEFTYESSARALAFLDRKPLRGEIDGQESPVLVLPRGRHIVRVITSP